MGVGFEPLWMPDFLFDFQRHLVEWAIRRAGRRSSPTAGWARRRCSWCGPRTSSGTRTGRCWSSRRWRSAAQTSARPRSSASRPVRSRDGKFPAGARVVVTNYERLHHFDPATSPGWCATSRRSSRTSTARRQGGRDRVHAHLPYRLLCTATAAPNDYVELGTSSEALGRAGLQDMLTRFFKKTDGDPDISAGAGRSTGSGARRAGLLAVGLLVGPGLPQAVGPGLRRRPVRLPRWTRGSTSSRPGPSGPGCCSTCPAVTWKSSGRSGGGPWPSGARRWPNWSPARASRPSLVPPERRGRPAGAAHPRGRPGVRGRTPTSGRRRRSRRSPPGRSACWSPSRRSPGSGSTGSTAPTRRSSRRTRSSSGTRRSAGAGGSARRGPVSVDVVDDRGRAGRAGQPATARRGGRPDVRPAGRTDERRPAIDRADPYGPDRRRRCRRGCDRPGSHRPLRDLQRRLRAR
jgi:hypothetical protein